MLIDQNYNLDIICKIMGQKQIICRFSNLRKMHWKLIPPVLGHLFYLKNRALYIFSQKAENI